MPAPLYAAMVTLNIVKRRRPTSVRLTGIPAAEMDMFWLSPHSVRVHGQEPRAARHSSACAEMMKPSSLPLSWSVGICCEGQRCTYSGTLIQRTRMSSMCRAGSVAGTCPARKNGVLQESGLGTRVTSYPSV